MNPVFWYMLAMAAAGGGLIWLGERSGRNTTNPDDASSTIIPILFGAVALAADAIWFVVYLLWRLFAI